MAENIPNENVEEFNDSSFNVEASYYPGIKNVNPTFIIKSGRELRNAHISKAYVKQLLDWVDTGVDPTKVSEETKKELMVQWTKESEIAFPGEGDYTVRILDENGDGIISDSEVTYFREDEEFLKGEPEEEEFEEDSETSI